MFCSNCGTALQDTDLFCATCGTPVAQPSQEARPTSLLSGNRKLFYALGGIVVATVLAGGLWLFYPNAPSSLSVETQTPATSTSSITGSKSPGESLLEFLEALMREDQPAIRRHLTNQARALLDRGQFALHAGMLLEVVALATLRRLEENRMTASLWREGKSLTLRMKPQGQLEYIVTVGIGKETAAANRATVQLTQSGSYGTDTKIEEEIAEMVWDEGQWKLEKIGAQRVDKAILLERLVDDGRMLANDRSTASSLRVIATANVTYSATYNQGFAGSLLQLGPPSPSCPTMSSGCADLLAADLSGVDSLIGGSVKSGYIFTYLAPNPNPTPATPNKTYSVVATPLHPGVSRMPVSS